MPRPRVWTDTFIDLAVASGGPAQFVDLSSTFLTNEMRLAQMTLVRTIIGIDVAYAVHDAGEGSQQATAGICVVDRNALAGGVGSIPNPNVALEKPIRPWVWRAKWRIFGFAADDPTIFTRRVDLDLRSQRKLENGEIVFIANNVPEEGAASVVLLSGLVRCLYLV